MYPRLLVVHSLFRWLVLAGLLYALILSWRGWKGNKPYSGHADMIRHTTATICHIQLMLGLWLYFISPMVMSFFEHFSEAVHKREIRFFGMEHSFMMVLGIVLITIGSMKAKRKTGDALKYKTMALWFTAGLLVILSSIPWAFSPLVSRPWWRWF